MGAAKKMSNFDRLGVEEAVRQKEVHGGTVTVLSLGAADSKKAVKEAMAMGADRAVLVLANTEVLDALGTACLLAAALQRMGVPDIVFCSEGSSDTYQAQVGAMLGELMGLPFLAYSKNVALEGGLVRCEQVFESYSLLSEARLPAIVSMVNGSNKPRFPVLLQVMAAAKKPIEEIPAEALKAPDCPKIGVTVLEVGLQVLNRKRVILDGPPGEVAHRLVEALRKEGVV